MKFRMISSIVASTLLAAGLALAPHAQAQQPGTILTTTSPDVIYMDNNGDVYDMTPMSGMPMDMDSMHGDMAGGSTGMSTMSPVKVEDYMGDWIPASDIPIFSGVVVNSNPVTQTAVVRGDYGYVSVSTAGGAEVFRNGELVSWLTAPIGSVVQLPISLLVDGPIPHRLHVNNDLVTSMKIHNMGMGMGTGMGGSTMTGTMGMQGGTDMGGAASAAGGGNMNNGTMNGRRHRRGRNTMNGGSMGSTTTP